MLYVLIYPVLPEDSGAAIDRFRARFEPRRAQLVRPHITLVFGTQSIDSLELASLCRSVADCRGCFEIGFAPAELLLDPLDGSYKLVLPVTDGRAAILSMQRELYQGPHRSEFLEDIGFAPHMTIGCASTRAAAETMQAASSVFSRPFSGLATGIALERLADGALLRHGVFPFPRASLEETC